MIKKHVHYKQFEFILSVIVLLVTNAGTLRNEYDLQAQRFLTDEYDINNTRVIFVKRI